jgi:hypothetical protein
MTDAYLASENKSGSRLPVNCLTDYFRCPSGYLKFAETGKPSSESGYFSLGHDAVCYGSYAGRKPSPEPCGSLVDAVRDIYSENGVTYLPFDPSQVVANLRQETYTADWRGQMPMSLISWLYYLVRPVLPVHVRRHLQGFHFRGWNKIAFPKWPVDCSVDNIMSSLLKLSMRAAGTERVPFVWFWPHGLTSCVIVTHDVETELGCNFSETLMDIDDSFGVKASFQIIPECRYTVRHEFLEMIRNRGFEVVVHDLNHDGHLYKNYDHFLERAAKINAYAREYGAEGFRAGSLYRKQLWYDALKVSYDMSVPNVAHLDPQRGGCCTVMPYFLGDILELPVTTTQDYTLFNILQDYSIELWKKQIELIMAKNGLISFIVHPDYIVNRRQRNTYEALLGYLTCLEDEKSAWLTTPGQVNKWWRQRSKMKLVRSANGWQVEGAGSERACVAYATLDRDKLSYELESTSAWHGCTR